MPGQTARMMGWLGCALAGGWLCACQPPPSTAEPIVPPMTERLHDREYFPRDHGEEENPELDCNLCHGGFERFTDFTCVRCHTHDTAWSDDRHRGIPDYATTATACLACHPMGTAAQIEHERFPIGPDTVHAEQVCQDCHPSSDFREFTCMSCHPHDQPTSLAQHGRVDGYRFEAVRCLACHPQGFSPARDHDRRFPITQGKHQAARCMQCHPQHGDRNYQAVDCLGCHEHAQAAMDQLHGTLDGYQWTTAACLRCHPQGGAAGLDHSRLFPIGAGTNHSTQACAACHPDGYGSFTCVSCHDHATEVATPQHRKVDAFQYTSSRCLACHPQGTSPGGGHEPRFPIAAGSHSTFFCRDCHPGAGNQDFRTVDCIGCHSHDRPTMATLHGTLPGYQWTSAACLQCHPRGEPASFDHTRAFPIGVGSSHAALACRDCHTTGYGSFSCVACHDHDQATMAPVHSGVAGYVWNSANCVSCHPDGRAMSPAAHARYFPIARGRHAMPCADCHTTPGDYSRYVCYECHTGAHTCAATQRYHERRLNCQSSQCYGCHPAGVGDD